MVLEKTVNNQFAGERLDVYLTRRYTYHTRNQWQKLIDEGKVTLNGQPAKSSTKIPRDSVMAYDLGDYVERPVNENYAVLLDDPDLMVIDKPPGIPVHTSGKYFNHTLIKILRRDFPSYELNLINRLDRETSGIILLSKTARARTQVGDQFRHKQVAKTYIAYCFGEIRENHFTVDAPIAEHVSPVVRIRMGIDAARGLPAQTRFEVIRRANGYTKLFCYPVTGRTNQIRVHLAHAGHPMIGDKLYSGDDNDFLEFIETGTSPRLLERLKLPRHALHAHKLSFTHPSTEKPMDVVSPEPTDLLDFERVFMNGPTKNGAPVS